MSLAPASLQTQNCCLGPLKCFADYPGLLNFWLRKGAVSSGNLGNLRGGFPALGDCHSRQLEVCSRAPRGTSQSYLYPCLTQVPCSQRAARGRSLAGDARVPGAQRCKPGRKEAGGGRGTEGGGAYIPPHPVSRPAQWQPRPSLAPPPPPHRGRGFIRPRPWRRGHRALGRLCGRRRERAREAAVSDAAVSEPVHSRSGPRYLWVGAAGRWGLRPARCAVSACRERRGRPWSAGPGLEGGETYGGGIPGVGTREEGRRRPG